MINGIEHEYELIPLDNGAYTLRIDHQILHLSAHKENSQSFTVFASGQSFDLIVRSTIQEKAIREIEQAGAGKKSSTIIKAPMPGLILKIKKKPGENVQQGESIIILEAMKMENDIHAPSSGILKSLTATEGNAVEKGAVLFTIE